MKVKWVFFDVGTTLVDEEKAYDHRVFDMIKDTNITFEEFNNKRIELARQGLDGNSAAIKYFNLNKTPYEEDNYIYHDTYFGSKEFYGEEIVYFDNLLIWHMEYKGGVLNDETTEIYAKVLKPVLKNVDNKLSLRGLKSL